MRFDLTISQSHKTQKTALWSTNAALANPQPGKRQLPTPPRSRAQPVALSGKRRLLFGDGRRDERLFDCVGVDAVVNLGEVRWRFPSKLFRGRSRNADDG